jgi:hypothetical protein
MTAKDTSPKARKIQDVMAEFALLMPGVEQLPLLRA